MSKIWEKEGKKSKGLTIASLVLGVVGLIVFFPFGDWCAPLGLIGLILSIIALIKKQGVIAIIGTVLGANDPFYNEPPLNPSYVGFYEYK